jgi:hypothetical protein
LVIPRADRLTHATRAYVALMTVGFSITFLVLPLLAFAGSWEVVALILVVERAGKAGRRRAGLVLLQAADSALSDMRAPVTLQRLWSIGFVCGPLLLGLVLWGGSGWFGEPGDAYRWAFASLAIPAALGIVALHRVRARFSALRDVRLPVTRQHSRELDRGFAACMLGSALAGFGLSSWPLLAFHAQQRGLAADHFVIMIYAAASLLYAVATLVALPGVAIRGDLRRVALLLLLAAAGLPAVLLGGPASAVAGVFLWALGLGMLDTIGQAVFDRWSSFRAHTIHSAVRGVSCGAGAVVIGAVSDVSLPGAAGISAATMLAGALVIFVSVRPTAWRSAV